MTASPVLICSAAQCQVAWRRPIGANAAVHGSVPLAGEGRLCRSGLGTCVRVCAVGPAGDCGGRLEGLKSLAQMTAQPLAFLCRWRRLSKLVRGFHGSRSGQFELSTAGTSRVKLFPGLLSSPFRSDHLAQDLLGRGDCLSMEKMLEARPHRHVIASSFVRTCPPGPVFPTPRLHRVACSRDRVVVDVFLQGQTMLPVCKEQVAAKSTEMLPRRVCLTVSVSRVCPHGHFPNRCPPEREDVSGFRLALLL